MISHPFRIGFVLVNPVTVEYTLRLRKFSNTPRMYVCAHACVRACIHVGMYVCM